MAIPPPSPAPQTPALSFPAHTYAKLAPAAYLHAHLTPPAPHTAIRPNGRTPTAARTPTATCGSLSHASGSAVLRLGDTAVVCGVRAEVLAAADVPDHRPGRLHDGDGDGDGGGGGGGRGRDCDEIAALGLLVPNLELATGCSPLYLPGGPPPLLAQIVTQRLAGLLYAADVVRLEELQIWEREGGGEGAGAGAGGGEGRNQPAVVRAWWTLYIDILFISLDGNAFDAAWGAVLAALADTLLPRAWWDADRGGVLCDPRVEEASRLRLRGFPVASSFAVFERDGRTWVLDDADDFEEALCPEGVTVTVDMDGGPGGGRLVRVEKGGGGGVGREEMRALVERAGLRWRVWRDVLGGK